MKHLKNYMKLLARCLVMTGLMATASLLTDNTASVMAQEQSIQIKLRLGDVSLNKLPFILAYDAGIYKRNGIDVTPMFTQSSVDTIRRSGIDVPDQFILKSGDETPICICGSSPAIVNLTTEAGAWDPINLGATHTTTRWRIVAGKANVSAIPESARSVIWNPSCFHGRWVGTRILMSR
jgi:hypothetical protein